MIGVALVLATMAAYWLAQKALSQLLDIIVTPRHRMSMFEIQRSFMWAKWKYDQSAGERYDERMRTYPGTVPPGRNVKVTWR